MDVSPDSPQTLLELLSRTVERYGEQPAVVDGTEDTHGSALTWNQLWEQVQSVAAWLSRPTLSDSPFVVIIGRPSVRWQIAEFAAMQAGKSVVGIEPHASATQRDSVLDELSPHTIFLERSALQTSFSFTSGLVSTQWVSLDAPNHFDFSWEQVLAQAAELPARTLPSVYPSYVATRIYTSGTTGQPKAIEYRHQQVLAAIAAIQNALPIVQSGDANVCWLPLAHLFQRMVNYVAIAEGVTTHFVADPHAVQAACQAVSPKQFIGVPRLFDKLVEAVEERLARLPRRVRKVAMQELGLVSHPSEPASEATLASCEASPRRTPANHRGGRVTDRWIRPLVRRLVVDKVRQTFGSQLQYIICGSARLSVKAQGLIRACGWELLEAYGISENTIPLAMTRPGAARPGSVGQPLLENELRLGPDREILVRGPGLFEGYATGDSKQLDASRLTPEGFFPTGDLGSWDADGYLYLTGRKSDFVKLSTGRKVALSNLESNYLVSPLIEQLVLLGPDRPFVSGIVVPSPKALASRLGLPLPTSRSELANHPDAHNVLAAEFDRLSIGLERHETVRKFIIARTPFSIEREELTPTLKLRRGKIEANYRHKVEALYQAATGNASHQQLIPSTPGADS